MVPLALGSFVFLPSFFSTFVQLNAVFYILFFGTPITSKSLHFFTYSKLGKFGRQEIFTVFLCLALFRKN